MPAYKKFGSGPNKVLALHNWFSDSSCYEPLLPYLDPSVFSLLFMDFRGYGVAKDFKGDYSLDEGVRDALALVQSQNWKEFHILGHAMGSFVAQKIALEHNPRVQSIIALNPIPPSGSPKTPELLMFLEQAAVSCDNGAAECIHALTNRRYSSYIVDSMVKKWRSVSTSEARLAYLHMLCESNFAHKIQNAKTPLLAVFGEHDIESPEDSLHQTFLSKYLNTKFEVCKDSGHFLLQETPVKTAGLITRFIHS